MRLSIRTFALACGITAAALPVAACRAQGSLAGDWRGYWTRAGDTLPVTLSVRRDSSPGRYRATFGAERLRVSGIPFGDVRVSGCCDVTMVLRGDRTTTEFTGTLRRDSLSGTLREGASEGRFAYRRVAAADAPAFREREVSYRNGDVTLAGTLLLPARATSCPVVVFLHGSGAEGRWASRYLAEQLVARGVGALVFDKRGVGRSTGDWRTATPEDLVSDAVAVVGRVAEEPGVDRARVGIYGHSQGGTLSPMVASKSPAVRFVVASAASGMPGDSVERYSILNSLRARLTTREDSADASAYVGELVEVAYHERPRARLDSLVAAARGRAWFFAPPPPENAYWTFSPAFARYDPLMWWTRVRVPVLLMYGGADERVPPGESAARIAAALVRGGGGDVTVRVFPGADHTFRLPPGPSGWPVTAPGYVESLLDWLARVTR